MADFDSLLTRFFGCVPTWGDDKLQESIADLHEAAMLRLKGLAASPEKKACYWQDYILSEVQMQAVWESVEKGVTALLAKVEASLPKPLLVQVTSLHTHTHTHTHTHACAHTHKRTHTHACTHTRTHTQYNVLWGLKCHSPTTPFLLLLMSILCSQQSLARNS